MAFSIDDPDTDRMARELAAATGETITDAVSVAVRERLDRLRMRAGADRLADELNAIALRTASLPVIDPRGDEEVLGLDEDGLPRGEPA